MNKKIKMISIMALVTGIALQPVINVKAVSLEKWENDSAASSYASGLGTRENPYIIKSVEQLLKLKVDATSGKEIDQYYELDEDIDLQGKLWTPIGTDSDGFYRAHLDGKAHKIKNMTIDENQDNVGLIAVNQASTVMNISLENVKIKGKNNVGALIGLAKDHMTISNSLIQNNVSGEISGDKNVGGLIGNVQYEVSTTSSSPITKSFANANVKGKDRVGGLIGHAQYVENIQECFATGQVTGTKAVGGLIGHFQATKILAAYTRCIVSGTSSISGFVGNSSMGTIEDSYSLSEVKNDTGEAFIENEEPKTLFDKCYYATDKAGVNATAMNGINGLKSSEMTAKQMNFNQPALWNMKDSTDEYDYFPQLSQISTDHTDDSNDSVQETRKYQVEFDLNGGQQLDNTPLMQQVEYNDIAKVPQVYKKGYTVSWDKDLRITQNVKIKAIYTPIAITSLEIQGSKVVYQGQQTQYQYTFLPIDALAVDVIWGVIDGKDCATISSTGLLNAKKVGEVVIQVALKDKPDVKTTYAVSIKDLTIENIKKDIQSLSDPLSRNQMNQVVLLNQSFKQLTSDQKNLVGKDLENKLNKAVKQAEQLMRNKDHVQMNGEVGELKEIFMKSLSKDYSQWALISQYTNDYLSEVYESYLFDHISNKKGQPQGKVEITFQVNEDYTKQKNVRIIMMKENGFIEIKPTDIQQKIITFETDYVNDFGIIYTQDIKGTQTSDSTELVLWVSGLLLAGLGIGIIMKKKRYSNE